MKEINGKNNEGESPSFLVELEICGGDEDGFCIKETEGDGKIYVYYSEIDELLQKLRKKRADYIRNKHLSQKSPGSKNTPNNAEGIYKSCAVEGFDGYTRYLRSDEWRELKRKVLQRDGYKCRNCGSSVGLQVHHKSYDRFGGESLDDLITLCVVCHKGVEHNKTAWKRGVVV